MNKPKLSIYVGESQVSALRYKSPKDYEFFSYPYVPLDSLSHNTDYKTRPHFLTEVMKKIFNLVDIEEYEVIVGDSSGGKNFGDDRNHISIGDALSSIHNYSWLMVEDFTIITPSDLISYFPFSDFRNNEEYINYFSNKSLYPQAVPQRREQYDREEDLLKKLSEKIEHKYTYETPLIFTGGKFFGADKNPGYMYVSALGFLRKPGIYEVKMDTQNKLPVIGLLNQSFGVQNSGKEGNKVGMLTADMLDGSQFHDEFISVGTVLRSQGRAECLFEKEDSSPQFVEIEKDKIFILPLGKNETARVSISTGKLGKVERNIKGGDIGFIIDTRENNPEGINPDWVDTFQERLESF